MEAPPLQPEETVTKPKKMNLSDEERQRRSDRMKALAKSRNDLLKKQREDKAGERPPTAPMAEPVQQPPATPVAAPAPAPAKSARTTRKKKEVPAVAAEAQAKAARATRKKRVVLVESSDSDDYGDSETSGEDASEDEVIYVAAKRSSKQAGMTKAKRAPKAPTVPIPAAVPEPQIRVKFF